MTILLIRITQPVWGAEPPVPKLLANGLRVVVRERHTSPLVAIDLWVRAGSREERAGENGCAHYLEHTLFKGTQTRGVGEVDFAIENLGGVLNASTGVDYAHFYTVVRQDKLEPALRIVADVVRNATLPEAEIERERSVILDELTQREADPDDALFATLYATSFHVHPYRFSPGGQPEAIRARKRETLLAFYRRTYAPERCTLALAGDVTPERALEVAQRVFGDWTRTAMREEGGAVMEPEPAAAAQEIPFPTAQARVGIAFRAPAASDAESTCLALVTMALLGSYEEGGRFGNTLWTGTGVEARYTPRRDPSLLLVTAAVPIPVPPRPFTAPTPPTFPDVHALEAALRKTLQTMRDTPPSQTELTAAKRRLLGKMLFDRETDASWARAIGMADCIGAEPVETLTRRLETVTPEQVQTFARRMLDASHCITVRIVPEEKAFSSYSCYTPVAVPIEPNRVKLPNGVRLILKPEPESEEVAIQMFVRHTPPKTPAEAAVCALVSKALFYGSVNRTFDSIAGSVARIGGNLSPRVAPDYTVYSCVTNEAQLHEAISLLCEALKNAEFTPEALERARQVTLREQQQRKEDLFYSTYEALCHATRGEVEPDAVALRHITQEQALAYYRANYVPAKTVITVVGKFDAARTQKSFDDNLFDYERAAPTNATSKGTTVWADTVALAFPTTGSMAYALIAQPAPPVTDPDYPAFTILSTLLGGGHASRLFHHIRDETGLGYNVGTFYQADNADPLVAYLQWDTRRASVRASTPNSGGGDGARSPTPEEALRLLQAQLDSLLKAPPSEAEVTRARNFAIGRDALRHEQVRERAFLLGWYETMGLGYTYDAQLPDRLAAVTRDDLLRLARSYLTRRATAVTHNAAR
ncbi:MAG TPA: pitrilysin family protein [Chthonomonadaceae bacterium]|nr:pitrilysin family protein [Chthonomonadaceae bacterium]